MKQRIYTCPYSVMLMMMLHNIDFEARRIDQTEWFQVESKEEITAYAISDDDFEYRVHPDDVHLYETSQLHEGEADLIKYGERYGLISCDEDGVFFIGEEPILDMEHFKESDVKILMRDGKPWIGECEIREVEDYVK